MGAALPSNAGISALPKSIGKQGVVIYDEIPFSNAVLKLTLIAGASMTIGIYLKRSILRSFCAVSTWSTITQSNTSVDVFSLNGGAFAGPKTHGTRSRLRMLSA